MLTREAKERFRAVGLFPIIIIFFFTVLVSWASAPIGTYDLAGDLWIASNWISSFLGEYNFSADYFMSHSVFYSFAKHVYILIPFIQVFGFESYLSVLQIICFFSGSVLLYILLYIVSQSSVAACLGSLTFSCSTVWFSTGDIFAMIPSYGVGNKTYGYIYILSLLIILTTCRHTRLYVAIISAATGLLVWIHPITFLGPGLAILLVAFVLYLIDFRENVSIKEKIAVVAISGIIFLGIVMPYVSAFSSSSLGGIQVTEGLTNDEKKEIRNDYYNDLGHRLDDPFALVYIRADFKYVENYKALFYLAVVILVLFRGNRYIRLFGLTGFVTFSTNLLLRKGEYLLGDGEWYLFAPLVRNDKWIYFFAS